MNIGEKFIWEPFNHATKGPEKNHPHFGKIVTIKGADVLNSFLVSVDDFPKVNDANANRFLADAYELKAINN